jgi:hypothetical protein
MKLVSGALRALVSQAPSAGKFLQQAGSLFVAVALCVAGLALSPVGAGAQVVVADDNFHYDNSWELSAGLAYAALPSGPTILPRAELPGLNVAATQWLLPRWGVTADYRGYAGVGNTNVNPYTVNSPLAVENFFSVGGEYRWIRTPAIAISPQLLGGGGFGTFNLHVPNGVTNGQLGIYPNGATFDVIGGANIDFNTSSGLGVRVSPNAIVTDFNGDLRTSFSITAGVVWRYGRF